MNKAEKAKLRAAESRAAEPGLGTAFAAVAVMIGGAWILMAAIYGLTFTLGGAAQ